ncbi:MAG: MBL fold metallo-hydrolase [Candidatus Lokiarchaeota archaeon]|nr:MBL fold metallo-hydrolase [Candidatus Lokiarchaeota archaeon]
MEQIKIIFLGTNGWFSTELGSTISTLIETNQYYIILDAGNGFYKIDQYISENKPILIFLSHLHLDHIIGLHSLSKFNFKQNLKLYTYQGTKKNLELLFNHPFSASLYDLPINLQIIELEEGFHELEFLITCNLLLHSDPSLGYRFQIDDKILTYCTDTGITESIYTLSKNADIFISECSYKPGQEEWGWPHLKAEEAALIARESNCKKLFLTHFDASFYNTPEMRKKAEKRAQNIFPNSSAAYDGMEFCLTIH